MYSLTRHFGVASVCLPLLFGAAESQGQSWTRVDLADVGLPSNAVTALHIDEHGRVWVGTTGSGLAEYSAGQWRTHVEIREAALRRATYQVRPRGPHAIAAIATDQQGSVWVAEHERALWLYRGGRWRQNGSTVGSSAPPDHRASHPGVLVSGSDCWEPAIFKVSAPVDDGVPYVPRGLVGLAVDPSDQLWLLPQNAFKLLYRFDGEEAACSVPEWVVDGYFEGRAVLAHPSGDIWVVVFAEEGGDQVAIFRNDQWWRDGSAPQLRPAVAVGVDGSVWGGVFEGVYRHKDGAWIQEVTWEVAPDSGTNAISTDGAGGVWIVRGFKNRTLLYHRDGRTSQMQYPHGEPVSAPQYDTRLAVDHSGRLWLGDSEGLFVTQLSTEMRSWSWGQVKAEPGSRAKE